MVNTESYSILLVTPSYRDAERLSRFGPLLAQALAQWKQPLHWLIADDGSGEEEVLRLKELCSSWQLVYESISVYAHPVHQGKGGILRTVFSQEKYANWLAFVDADGSIDARSLIHLLSHAEQSAQGRAFLASRKLTPFTEVKQSFRRRQTHRIFAWLSRKILGWPIEDGQCGGKLIHRQSFESILPKLREDGFIFDVEWLLALGHDGVRLVEVPVNWTHVGESRVNAVKETCRMTLGLLRQRHRFGVYPAITEKITDLDEGDGPYSSQPK